MYFHEKYHAKNHHTNPTAGFPDSASDPIASSANPFMGDFVIQGTLRATSIDIDSIPTLTVETLEVTNQIATLSVATLTVANFAAGTNGSNLIGVDAVTLEGLSQSQFEQVTNKNLTGGYAGLDANGKLADSVIPSNIIVSSINFIDIIDYVTTGAISTTVAPLVSSDNAIGREIPSDYIPDTLDGKYAGFFDYNASDALSSINLTADTWYVVENDAAGSFTLTSYGPLGVSSVWNTSTNRFDFSELKLGDMVEIRFDCEITTTVNNQAFEADLVLAESTPSEYKIPFVLPTQYKTPRTGRVLGYSGFYIGNTDTLSSGGYFEIITDDAATLKVNGWYVKVTRR